MADSLRKHLRHKLGEYVLCSIRERKHILKERCQEGICPEDLTQGDLDQLTDELLKELTIVITNFRDRS